jgi:hypothetical protein
VIATLQRFDSVAALPVGRTCAHRSSIVVACGAAAALQKRVEKLMGLYDKKTATDRKRKTRARIVNAARGKRSGRSGDTTSDAQSGDGFQMHSALNDAAVDCAEDDDDAGNDESDDHVAECEDEIDRQRRRHDVEVQKYRERVGHCDAARRRRRRFLDC